MREYIIFGWCCAWWAASIHYFISNWRVHQVKFGYLHIPVAIFTGVFSPGLVIAEMVVSIIKWLFK